MPTVLLTLVSRLFPELSAGEVPWVLSPARHLSLLSLRVLALIRLRTRLLCGLFAVFTLAWVPADLWYFPAPLGAELAFLRVLATAGFLALLAWPVLAGRLRDARRQLALLLAILAVFHLAAAALLAAHPQQGAAVQISAGYGFLPFVLMVALCIFPLTLAENLTAVAAIMAMHGAGVFLRGQQFDLMRWLMDLWLLAVLAGVAAMASMSQLGYIIALVREAIRDPLTGCFSRSSGEELLQLQLRQSERSGEPLSIAFLDLDHFKQVNDRFGHDAGDEVLRAAAAHMHEALRGGDVLARWGGEEFVILLAGTDLEHARSVLERVRQAGFGRRPDGGAVTASVGLVDWRPGLALSARQLVEQADHRMYLAKQAGRDRIVAADAA